MCVHSVWPCAHTNTFTMILLQLVRGVCLWMLVSAFLTKICVVSCSHMRSNHRVLRLTDNNENGYNVTGSDEGGTTLSKGIVVDGDDQQESDEGLTKMLDDLQNGYDSRIRPHATGPPVVVLTNIHVLSGFSTVAATMDFNLMVFIRQQWNDPRLKFNGDSNYSLSVSPQLVEKLWVPDMFFANEKDGKLHQLTVKNEALRIYPNGDILLSMRVSLTLACNMNLRYYPMDVQLCHLSMESYGYRTHDLQFRWTDENAVDIDDEIEIAEFRDPLVKTIEYNKTYTTGTFSALRAYFKLRRIHEHQLLQTYLPITSFVIISWLSFWITPEAVPARVSLCITTVLTVTAQSTGIRSDLPRVAYIKAIDIWMTTCLVFVFAALTEYALINYLITEKRRYDDKTKAIAMKKIAALNEEDDMSLEKLGNDDRIAKSNDNDDGDYYIATWMSHKMEPAKVDKVSRWLFPLIFLLFNVLYWPICLISYYSNLFDDIKVGEAIN
ncbi:glycine receptor subunit alphaZ1-like [Ptychodera flava]|uniref:glycine receptor subunit alphaZ1-like n=1 Tax=Ptychodera flava TaxID=63121 RepID=UPI003969E66D